ncbi:hypothetical protein V1477_003167 [Vespula maculifrons]|uniref:Uncharacterized protein n=1 Tax=Vespula maculifrons TaxID=7453 RepID=A0ABD2CTR9_VESMC
MFALQKTVGSARLAKQIVQQRRTVVDLPPSVKVSFIEKLLGGVAITVSILGIPTYVSCNIKNYKKN